MDKPLTIYGICYCSASLDSFLLQLRVRIQSTKALEGDILSRGKRGHGPVWTCAFSYTKYFSPWHYGLFDWIILWCRAVPHIEAVQTTSGFYIDASQRLSVLKIKNDSKFSLIVPWRTNLPLALGTSVLNLKIWNELISPTMWLEKTPVAQRQYLSVCIS